VKIPYGISVILFYFYLLNKMLLLENIGCNGMTDFTSKMGKKCGNV
jgi:hypothetical protein